MKKKRNGKSGNNANSASYLQKGQEYAVELASNNKSDFWSIITCTHEYRKRPNQDRDGQKIFENMIAGDIGDINNSLWKIFKKDFAKFQIEDSSFDEAAFLFGFLSQLAEIADYVLHFVEVE